MCGIIRRSQRKRDICPIQPVKSPHHNGTTQKNKAKPPPPLHMLAPDPAHLSNQYTDGISPPLTYTTCPSFNMLYSGEDEDTPNAAKTTTLKGWSDQIDLSDLNLALAALPCTFSPGSWWKRRWCTGCRACGFGVVFGLGFGLGISAANPFGTTRYDGLK